jgi:ABC-type transport system substrate-binding protein
MGLQADAIMQQIQAGDADLAYDVNVPTAILATLAASGDEAHRHVGRQHELPVHQHGVE